MARRPPQRTQTKPSGSDADSRVAFPGIDPAAGTGDPGTAPRVDARAFPASREEFVGNLAELREQGSLDVADEAAVLREYDQLLAELKVEKSRLEAEFRERTEREGLDAAQSWLSEAAGALGRQQGTRMRNLFQTIPALNQPPAPA